jgi:catechol 2,3-dioxygenase-like lactoylglutathione lyase family enzyme
MFSHIMVGANNIEASKKFYDAVFAALDVKPGFTDDKGRVFYRTKTGVFAISKPIDGKAASFANGGTIGFTADSAEKAEAWHKAGVAHGGTTCEDPPGWRQGAMGKMYLAYLRDPAGNKICVLHRPS